MHLYGTSIFPILVLLVLHYFITPVLATSPTPSLSLPSTPTSHLNDLELRAGVGAAGGPADALPSPTQMSPATTYMVRGPNGVQSPMPYTQTFVKVPDQWPAPTQGTIGLGTIQGAVGVVKTVSKRDPVPTGVLRARTLFEEAHRAVWDVSGRRRRSGSGSIGGEGSESGKKKSVRETVAQNGASGVTMSMAGVAGAAAVGLGVVVVVIL